MRINEFRFENDIESQIDEFGILSDKIDKVKMELSELSNRYKESFEESLTKVNKQTKKVLEDILLSTKTVSRVVSTIGVQRIDEISLKSMMKKNNKSMDDLNEVLKRMIG